MTQTRSLVQWLGVCVCVYMCIRAGKLAARPWELIIHTRTHRYSGPLFSGDRSIHQGSPVVCMSCVRGNTNVCVCLCIYGEYPVIYCICSVLRHKTNSNWIKVLLITNPGLFSGHIRVRSSQMLAGLKTKSIRIHITGKNATRNSNPCIFKKIDFIL